MRVEGVAIAYLQGGTVLASKDLTASFFESSRLPRPEKIEGASRETWPGVCLEGLPDRADAVRFDLALVERRGLRLERSRQSIVVPVASAPPPVRLSLPFRGHWAVSQGHGCGSNHRMGGRGGDFAWDFAFVDRDDGARRAREGASFGREVLSPVAGRVVRVVGDVEDNRGLDGYPRRSLVDDLKRPDWVYGNYAVIESGGRYVLLAHLERGSLAVAVGDEVVPGRVVGRAGNSGNTFRSHVHVHVMDRPDPGDPAVRGIPARLVDYVEIRGTGSGATSELLVRRMGEGDPPERSLVAPDIESGGAKSVDEH